MSRACKCGHARAAHDHYDAATWCVHCPCQRFRRPWLRKAGAS